MFFEDSDSGDREAEVRISAREDDSRETEEEDRSKLEKEAESKLLGGASGASTGQESSTESVTVEDIHRQNERIIELLEDLKSEDSESSSGTGNDEIGGAAADGLL